MPGPMTDEHYDWLNQVCGVDLKKNASTDPNAGQPNQSVQPPPPPPPSKEEKDAAERKRLEAYDKPIEFDPVGQAIPGLLVGGALSLVKGAVEIVGTVVGEAAVSGYDWVKEKVSGDHPAEGAAPEGGSGAGGAPPVAPPPETDK